MRTILVATTGLTPAVLTETVWALAQEKPPVIPDAVIVLTTATGRAHIEQQLFGPDAIWQQLRRALLGPKSDLDPRLDFDRSPDRVKVVHHRVGTRRLPLDELATPAQNTAFADAITQELWVHTSQPDTRVVASLAGGFKTMSALMLSAMQLLANPGDRVTHILVSGGYESATPPFFFPKQKEQLLRARDGSALRAADAASRLQLIDLPVIPLRRWFADALDRKPPSYETLVHGSLAALEAHAEDLTLELGPVAIPNGESKHWIRLNSIEHRLSPDRYVYLRFFAERLHAGEAPYEKLADTIDTLETWLADHKDTEPRFHRMWEAFTVPNAKHKDIDADDLPKRLKDLRTFLERLPGGRALATALPAKGHWALRLEKARVRLA
jgi:CRISPR-associated protein (TIGR02584 family)